MNENDQDVYCTEEEMAARLALCQTCQFFKIREDGFTECESSGCLINLMTTMKFKICPIGKWT